MKKFFLSLLILLTGGGGGYYAYNQLNLGSSQSSKTIMIATPTHYKSLPPAFSEQSSTTTDATMNEGGATLYQDVIVEGAKTVRLNISAIGGTATSTLHIRPQVSYDSNYYYYLTTSSVSIMGTSTVGTLYPSLAWVPGTVTSTRSFTFDTNGIKTYRFLIYGDNVYSDPNDFLKAYIEAIVDTEYN